jgi:hypothetical protein
MCSASRFARIEQTSPVTSGTLGGYPYMRRQATCSDDCKCFFCGEARTETVPLHEVMTLRITQRVKQCALKLQDQKLIAQLCHGDLVAQETKYHSPCLVKLYNACIRKVEKGKHENSDGVSHGIALVELIGYIQDTKMSVRDVAPIFKLTDLLQLYTDRLIELGVDITGRIHSTDLKNRILANVPGLNAYKEGRDVMLGFDDDIGHALRDVCLDDADDEAICLAKAAHIIRRDMLGIHTRFDGSFTMGCQEDAVPKSLVALISMIMDGPNITEKDTNEVRQATLSLAQLLEYNSYVRRRQESTS